MSNFSKVMLTVFVVLYIVSPVDLCPGCPIDDALVLLLRLAANKKMLAKPQVD